MLWVKILAVVLFSTLTIAQDQPLIDCHPEPGASQAECQTRGCQWAESQVEGAPWCFYRAGTTGYNLATGFTQAQATLTVAPNAKNPYYENIKTLTLKSAMIGTTLNVRIEAPNRYEPPLELPRDPSNSTSASAISLALHETGAPGDTFSFTVERNGVKIWDTSIGGLLFGDQFIQIATLLPTKNIYGFGEHIHQHIRHNTSRYTTWPMFTRDIGPNSQVDLSTMNLYGVHPFYMGIEGNGDAHGVLILNSNAQEVTIGTGPHLVYRTIGGILDLYFFPGPRPEEVIKQYQALIGKPMFPSYSGLGFQLCRWGYEDLNDMKGAVKRTQDAGVPLEIVIADIDYMERYKDFSLGWPGLKEYVEELHQQGLKVTLMTDAAIQVNYGPFERALKKEARFIEWPEMTDVDHTVQDIYPLLSNTKIMPGNVWPDNNTGMPDFLDPTGNTTQWWIDEFLLFHDVVPHDYIWIDMNEPSNFDTDPKPTTQVKVDDKYRLKCPVNGPSAKYDNPKYLTNAVYVFDPHSYLFTKTLCLMGTTAGGKHRLYDTHSIYGLSMAIASADAQKALGSRGTLISRSTFPSAGHYTGHWLGDNTASWGDLRTSVIGAQEFNMFGFAYVGSDICGFNADTTKELCLRWHQMGAFHPYSRNHNAQGHIRQDPAQWPEVAEAAKKALYFKYHYLPYLYTLMYEASTSAGSVIRPLFFEFPKDPETYDLGYQFMWGSGMMIMPVVHEGVTNVSGYIPPQATWYHLREDKLYGSKLGKEKNQEFSAQWTEMIPVFVRGGVIIPRQMGAPVLRDARKNPFELLIATEFKDDGTPIASEGKLFWDDGDSELTEKYFLFNFKFEFTATTATFTITKTHECELPLPLLKTVEILGYAYVPDISTFKVNGNPPTAGSINVTTSSSGYATIITSELDMKVAAPTFTVTWSHSAAPSTSTSTSKSASTAPSTPPTSPTTKAQTTTPSAAPTATFTAAAFFFALFCLINIF